MLDGVGFGVLGARSMVARLAVLPALDSSTRAHLVAACALGGPIDDRWAGTAVDSYEAVIEHPDVEAVYIPLPNGMHLDWIEKAAQAGRHVLCEKPLAPTAHDAERAHDLASAAGVLVAEAWMTPFDPRWQELHRLAHGGLVGPIDHISSAFTFTIGPEAAGNYRWDPQQGGGALLDVGIYCLGPVVEHFGHEPDAVTIDERILVGGVDATTAATLRWADGRTAQIRCSFVEPEVQRLEFGGPGGALVLDGDAHTGGTRARTIEHVTTTSTQRVAVRSGDPYLAMLDRFAAAVRDDATWPRPLTQTIELLTLIDRIRETPA